MSPFLVDPFSLQRCLRFRRRGHGGADGPGRGGGWPRRAFQHRIDVDTGVQLARGNALVSEMERLLEAGADVDGVLQDAVGAAGPPAPRAVSAAVPKPPEPQTPLNRRERRALERLRRRTRQRSANRA